MNHIVITPVFNEAKYLGAFIESIKRQTNRPQKLILVDDNSTDDSARIIKQFCTENDWIQYVFHASEKRKSQGKKVINAFNFGLEYVDISSVDYISKLDSDLELPDNYFSEISKTFSDPKVGIAGGVICERDATGKWVRIPQAYYHVRGALKSYRVSCFKEIGGIQAVLGWDGLDEMTAIYLGWKTKVINEGVNHFRPASQDYDLVKLNFELGFANWKNGRNFFLAIVRSVKSLKKKPYGRVSLAFMRGYVAGMRSGEQRNVTPELAKFINSFHLKRMFGIKHF